MPFTIADVGPRIVGGVEEPLTDAEKQVIVDQWNAEAAKPKPVRPLRKLAIVDRMTDAELDQAMAFFATPEGQRPHQRWNAATEIDTTKADTRAMFEALYGAARTDELLAPE